MKPNVMEKTCLFEKLPAEWNISADSARINRRICAERFLQIELEALTFVHTC